MAALIRSLLVQVFELGESPQSSVLCGVEGEYGIPESLIVATALFLPSFGGAFVGVDGANGAVLELLKGMAVGRALKNRCE